MLSKEQVAQFKANGFVNGGVVLKADEVDTLRAELARVLEDRYGWSKKEIRGFLGENALRVYNANWK